MDLVEAVLHQLKRMGCLCFKSSIEVEGVQYKLIKHIADGGFSSVELVEDTRSGKKFAIKRITCHSIEDQNLARSEIDITRRLGHHPNIVSLVGAELHGNADIVHNITSEAILVFPFYSRGTLHDELMRRRETSTPLPQSVLLSLFHSICSSVRELHSSSPPLAHRDIKPHNVLLDKDLRPLLMDFGSCCAARVSVRTMSEAQYLQDTAAERSTISYRPPELFQVNSNCDIDEKTDIWSLGCLLYAMMYYESPYDPVFARGDSVALAVQAGKISFEPSTYSEELQELVSQMTIVDVEFRTNIDSVMEKVEILMNKDNSTV